MFQRKNEQQANLIINLKTDPTPVNNWVIKNHRHRRFMRFDSEKICCFISADVSEVYFLKKLLRRFLLDANVLDHLLKHQSLIPKSWTNFYIVFLGTVYVNRDGKHFARCLYNDGHQWLEDALCIEGIRKFNDKQKIPYIGFFSMLKLFRF